jgi:hypothetical protein
MIREEERDMKLNENVIIKYLISHVGEETSTYEVVKESHGEEMIKNVDSLEWMDINDEVRKLAKLYGFKLDSSKYYGMVVGLPYNIPFVIIRKRGNKYDDPFMTMDRETSRKIADQNTPVKKRNKRELLTDEDYAKAVMDIAKKEVRKMSNEDKEFYLNHPDYTEHHFEYGMYLRNRYIHGKYEHVIADNMSDDIFETIIKLLRKRK